MSTYIYSAISTHAPLARRDYNQYHYSNDYEISTHAPLARRDITRPSRITLLLFLLTRLSRGATTRFILYTLLLFSFLLTRLSRGATTLIHVHPYIGQFLLTRLSRGATKAVINVPKTETFLLTRLSRGATKLEIEINKNASISTHAPLARRDFPFSQKTLRVGNFYSRASREARQQLRLQGHLSILHFYSRASREARRRTI